MLRYKPNPSQVRSLNRKEFLKTKENNLENVRELNKNAQIRKRFQSLQLHTTKAQNDSHKADYLNAINNSP